MMLYFLYSSTLKLSLLHRAGFRFVRHIEFPFLRTVFLLAGARKVILRHSGSHGNDFNLFASDVDLSIECESDRFEFIHRLAETLKIIFLNLGEIEFYTPEEWIKMEQLLQDPLSEFWSRLLLLRKRSWQMVSASQNSHNPYQKAKVQRGLALTRKKLQLNIDQKELDELFPELAQDLPEEGPGNNYSKFLESEIVFKNAHAAKNFWSILPDSRNIPSTKKRRELKLYILRREYFLTLVSLRAHILTGKFTDLETKREWLRDLQGQIDSLSGLSQVPEKERSSKE